MGRIGATKNHTLIISKRGSQRKVWRERFATYQSGRPQPFRIVLFRSKCLQQESTTHLFNLSTVYTELYQGIKFDTIIHTMSQ